jgi:hypothetical protein
VSWTVGFGAAGVALFLGARTALPAVQDTLRSPRFQLRTVHWIGLRTLESAELAPLLALPQGIALVDVDVDALAASVRRHARVARVDALRVPPDQLLLRVGEREPIGRIADEAEGFDRSGSRFPLRKGEAEVLVPVKGDPQPAIPLRLEARRRGIELAGIEVRGTADVRFRVRGSESVIRTDAEVARALGAWESLEGAGLVGRYRPEEVDLRFRGSAVFREIRTSTEGGEHVSSRGTDRRS